MFDGSDPETSIAVPKQLVGIELTASEEALGANRRWNRICNRTVLNFAAGQLYKFASVPGQ